MGVSLAWAGENAIYLPFRHEMPEDNYDITEFRPYLQRIVNTLTVEYHNSIFDLVSLRTLGIDTTQGQFMDTMLLTHMLNEELITGYGLDSLGKLYLKMGKQKSKMLEQWIDAFGWATVPPKLMSEYARFDAYLSCKIDEDIIPQLIDEGLSEVWAAKQKFVQVMVTLGLRGIKVDTDLCRRKIAEGEIVMAEIVDKLGGLNPASSKDQYELFINKLGLPPVMKERKGKLEPTISFDKTTMALYDEILEERDDKTASLVVQYRGWQKSISSNYQPYLDLLSPDGRLRANYKLHGTKTGRMSCERPNLQQIPRKGIKPWNGEMKACFIAEDGFALWEFDYAQLELRIGTAYAEEKKLIEIFNDRSRDIFSEMAAELSMERQDTKTMNYALAYGAGVRQLSKVFKVSFRRAEEMRENYFEQYPGFRKAAELAAKLAKRDGKVKLWNGRYGHRVEPHKAFNRIIQGGAAAVVEATMVRLADEGYNTDQCRMLLQVHDSVVFEIRKEIVDDITPGIIKCMEAVPAPFEHISFKVEGKAWPTKV